MKKIILKLGQINTVLIITLASVMLSVILTLFINFIMQAGVSRIMLPIAIIVPVIVAPIASWPIMGLLLKINDLEEEMRNLATYDSLTGLLSRQAFFHGVKNYIDIAERGQMPFTVLLIDLDNFKSINDRYGHPAGDEVLKSFGVITQTILRKADLLGRIGGEEFAIMLSNTTKENAYIISKRLHTAINESTVIYEGLSIKYTISMGVVSSKKDTDTAYNIEDMLKQADQALYTAKEKGRNCTVVFNENKTLN